METGFVAFSTQWKHVLGGFPHKGKVFRGGFPWCGKGAVGRFGAARGKVESEE